MLQTVLPAPILGGMRRHRKPNTVLIALLCSLALGAIVGVLVLADMSQRQTPQERQGATAKRPASSKVNYANFARLRDGMTREQVIKILGPGYTAILSVSVEGSESEVLQWEQAKDRVAVVGFENGRVTTRSQAGLR